MNKTFKKTLFALTASSMLCSVMPVMAEDTNEEPKGMTDLIVEGNNALASQLFNKMYDKDSNLFISPYSIYTALSMFSHFSSPEADTDGEEVRAELLKLLGLDADIDEEEFAKAQKELADTLNASYLDSDLPTFLTANALVNDISLKEEADLSKLSHFLDFYGAEISYEELSSQEGIDHINEWADKNTNGLIPELVSEPFDANVLSVLMNAVYFSGQWSNTFSEENTSKDTFNISADKTADVDMMHISESYNYMETDDFQIIQLPYISGFVMNVYLPKDIDTVFDEETVNELLSYDYSDFDTYEVDLSMPRFELTCSNDIAGVIRDLGAASMFDGHLYDRYADTELAIGSIIHDTKLKVNENGTEAAAITAMIIERCAIIAPENKVEMKLDHPFMFTISNAYNDLITFMGCFNMPEE